MEPRLNSWRYGRPRKILRYQFLGWSGRNRKPGQRALCKWHVNTLWAIIADDGWFMFRFERFFIFSQLRLVCFCLNYGRPMEYGRPLFFPLRFLLLLSFFLAYSQPSQTGCLPYFHTWCGLRANLRCRSETCCSRLTENTGRKKVAIWAPSLKFVGLYLRN